jgi:hypothetical protein
MAANQEDDRDESPRFVTAIMKRLPRSHAGSVGKTPDAEMVRHWRR